MNPAYSIHGKAPTKNPAVVPNVKALTGIDHGCKITRENSNFKKGKTAIIEVCSFLFYPCRGAQYMIP